VLQIAQKSCGLAVSDLDFCGSSNLDLTGQLWKILRIDFVANDARRSFRAIERVCCWAFADIKTGTFMQATRSTAGSGQRKPWALLRPRSSQRSHTRLWEGLHILSTTVPRDIVCLFLIPCLMPDVRLCHHFFIRLKKHGGVYV
jgi:hypothetical protein